MTKEYANYYNKSRLTSYNTVSLARITDFVIIVLLSGIVSFIWTYNRSRNMTLSTAIGIIFMLLASVFMYSVNLRLAQRKNSKVNVLANKLYLQSYVQSSTNETFGNLLVDLFEKEGFKYMPDSGSGYRLGKDRRFYFLYPMRRFHNHTLTGQDVMYVCDIARRKNYKRVIIAASCKIDPLAVDFSHVVENIEVTLMDIDNINEMYMQHHNDIPSKELEDYRHVAKLQINREVQTRRSMVKMFPAIRYLLCGIMLFIASAFMPFNSFYVISGGVCLAIFVLLILFPRFRRTQKQ